MTNSQHSWQRVTELFEQALEQSPEKRAEFVKSVCAGDADLLREVESLLAQHDAETGFLESPAVAVIADQIADKPEPPRIGKQLGQYRIETLLGRGGMGEVHVAQDKLGRKVALKLLTQRFPGDESGVARFQQEARTLLALNHPHIVTIHDIDQIEGVYYIASELVEGETFRQRLDEGDMPLQDVLEIAIQVATALAAAHEKGIVHRDIKPENIMIRRDGFVKVLDFGIAKLTEKPSTGESEASTLKQVQTAEGTVIGTAPYMSPEQARGLQVDARTDIWSLGVVIYEAVAGRKPFSGDTFTDVINSVIEKTPAPLTRYAVDVPEALDWIVTRALRKEKDARYQTANELLTDLKELRTRIELAKATASEAPPASTLSRSKVGTSVSLAPPPTSSAEYLVNEIKSHKRGLLIFVSALIVVGAAAAFAYFKYFAVKPQQISSIAILPFVNETKNADVEYLSDGMTESLINNLSQLSDLSVKARSSVFRYKGKEIEPQKAASELSVQAILSGRVVQRGDDLTLYLSLVDGRNGNQIWGQQYDRKLTDLVALQSEIARDVSQKLRVRLSGAEAQKVARNYTENTEAYQLYLKGRYHVFKLTPPEIQSAISYFQQAIAIDPNYALAYVGLASAYRALSLSTDRRSTEVFPQAKAAAQKAIQIDDTLAEGHAVLGFTIFWYDWDWNAAEDQFKRALQLDPNSADSHWAYAHLLSNTGRHAEALAEIKRARELDPLNVIINTSEGFYLLHAGQTDEALAKLQKTLELDPNFWLAHMFVSSAYAEQGKYSEAIAEARKAKEHSASSQPTAFLGYALAKYGKQAEARALLEELLKSSSERYVPPYHIALIYNGLGERDQTLAWLERGFEERDPRMVFLKVEPKWNNLRADPKFQDLMRRVGFNR